MNLEGNPPSMGVYRRNRIVDSIMQSSENCSNLQACRTQTRTHTHSDFYINFPQNDFPMHNWDEFH